MKKSPFSSQNKLGFSLMEVMISLAIISILISGVFGLILLSIRITEENKYAVEAINIANQRMERIRNMPYNQVGTVGGTIPGPIPQMETVVRNGSFDVYTYILFYDDPYDGEIGSTTPDINSCGTDYKIVTIKVVWQGKYGEKNIKVFSKIIPKNIETSDGYGTMKISINDLNGLPVPSADIHVYKVLTSTTTIDASYPAGVNGVLYLPVPAATGYKLTVSKPGYETVSTMEATTTNLNPIPQDWNVSEGALVENNIEINKLVNLDIQTVSQSLPENWQVNTASAPSDSTNPKAGIDNGDNMYFVWQRQDSASSSLYMQKYDSAGNKEWANDIRVYSNTNFQKNPDISVISDGTSYVVWQDTSSNLKATAPLVKAPKIYNQQIKNIRITQSDIQNKSWLKKINFPIIAYEAKKEINNLAYFFKNSLTKKAANAAGNIVQSKIGSNTYVGSNMSATFDAPPTAGNVLIAIAAHRNSNDSFSAPTNANGNFTVSAYSNTAWSLDVGIWHKVAGVGEDSTININSSGSINGGVLMIIEVSGLDTANLLNVTKTNDQTGGSGLTATTGNSPVSTTNGFAIAAIVFADDDFSAPLSTNWTSGSSDAFSQTLWREWGASTYDGSLAVAVTNINSASSQNASLTLSGGGSEERNSVLAVYNNFTYAQASADGSQMVNINTPALNQYIGGKFIISNVGSARNVTDISISENGTIDAQNSLENIKLFYDFDTSVPYDCASESFSGSEAQFGANGSFSSADGTVSFSDSKSISTTQSLCTYPVFDINTNADTDDTIDIYINNPTSDIIVSSGSVVPATPIALSGTTQVLTEAKIHQTYYRFRKNDGTETLATYYDSQNDNIAINMSEEARIRFGIYNSGNLSADLRNYQLEYAEKTLDCSNIPELDWETVPNDNSLAWRMNDSIFITNGDPSTNIADGLTDGKTTFIPGFIQDTNGLTGPVTLGYDEFTEIEYSILATANANDISYCFRLTNSGTADLVYDNYPEISIIGDNNIYIATVSNAGIIGTVKKINSEIGSSEQLSPRIASTENFGQATSSVVWQDERNGSYDIYLQILDNTNIKQIANEIQITASGTDEYSPIVAIDSNDKILIAWLENDLANQNLYVQKYDLFGNAIWPSAKKIISATSDYYYPEIKTDNNGNFFLAWTDDASGILNSYFAKFDTDANLLWQRTVNSSAVSSNRQKPNLIIGSTDIYTIWTDNRDGNQDVFTQRYDLSGTASWADDQRINIGTDSAIQDNSGLFLDSTDRPYGFWQDGRNTREEIFATRFNDPGAINPLSNIDTRASWERIIGIDVNEPVATTSISDASGWSHMTVGYSQTGYTIDIDEIGKTVILKNPSDTPLLVLPGETKTIILYVE